MKELTQELKKPHHVTINVFALYAPKKINIDPATSQKTDTEIIVLLPKNSPGFVTSKFREEEIHEFNAKKRRLWVEILNKSYEENIEIKKNSAIGFIVIEPENLLHKHASTGKKKKRQTKYRKKRQTTSQKRKRQFGGFLNRYDFACAGRDTVNQAAKVAPSIIKAATNDIKKLAEH